jgi:hypothetical protein
MVEIKGQKVGYTGSANILLVPKSARQDNLLFARGVLNLKWAVLQEVLDASGNWLVVLHVLFELNLTL